MGENREQTKGYTYQISYNSTANGQTELRIMSNYCQDSGLAIWASLSDVYNQKYKYKPYRLKKNHEKQLRMYISKTIYNSTTFCPRELM